MQCKNGRRTLLSVYWFETGVTPPESHTRENLLVVCLRDGSNVLLCANSEDEAL